MPIGDGIKLEALRAKVKAGTDALERGDFTEVDDADLEGYLERLTPAPKHVRKARDTNPDGRAAAFAALPEHLEGTADFVRSLQ